MMSAFIADYGDNAQSNEIPRASFSIVPPKEREQAKVMPSLISSSTHVTPPTTTALPGSAMWLPNQPDTAPSLDSPKQRAEQLRFPVAGVNHEKLISSDQMLADERRKKDLVAARPREQVYYLPTRYVFNAKKAKSLGSEYLQIEDDGVNSSRAYAPPFSLIMTVIACFQTQFSSDPICDEKLPSSRSGNKSQHHQVPFYELYFLKGNRSGNCLCMDSKGKLYVDDCTKVMQVEGRAECVFYMVPMEKASTTHYIYSYAYPNSLKKCKDPQTKKQQKDCKKNWYVQIKNGRVRRKKAAGNSKKLDYSVQFVKTARKSQSASATPTQSPKPNWDSVTFVTVPPTPSPQTLRPKWDSVFVVGQRRKQKRTQKKKVASQAVNFLSVPSRVRHRKSKSRRKGTSGDDIPFLVGHE